MKSALFSRRDFLEFMGSGLAVAGMSGCALRALPGPTSSPHFPFQPIAPSSADELILAAGFRAKVLISYGDSINSRGDRFGTHNDFTAIIPFKNKREGLLWVNHEYLHLLLVSGHAEGSKGTRAQVEKEMKAVGGSILKVKQVNGSWQVQKSDRWNRRLDATTKIPFAWKEKIGGSHFAIGTMGNCAGGVTPWGNILTCEEGHAAFYGDLDFATRKRTLRESDYNWTDFFDYPAEHYGWVVEVNPQTAKAKKLVALGRFAHEGATCRPSADGRTVVYMGDDTVDQCLYKFIASKPGSLEEGDLYVANMEESRWELISFEKRSELQKMFKNQSEVLIFTREAAKAVGGTPLHRPEDIEICPRTGAVIVALTYSKPRGDLFGSLLRLEEKNSDPLSLEFSAKTLLAGGPGQGFSCPDNLAFDRAGNLWMTTDISTGDIGKPPYDSFKNNGLFYIPIDGPRAGEALQVASAPVEAEFTGPSFSPDGRTLLLSIQHPGELTNDLKAPTSRWPGGPGTLPRSSVVAITGPAMEALVS